VKRIRFPKLASENPPNPLLSKGSFEKIQIGKGKASPVGQGMGKFAPPKSAGYTFSPKSPPDFRKGTQASWR
jgi:hypothetical protein